MQPMPKGAQQMLHDLIDKTATHIVVGLGWDPAPLPGFFASLMGKKTNIDLNLICLVFNKQGDMIANITGDDATFGDKAIQHTGDDRLGMGTGDDEQIFVNPALIPAEAEHLVFAMYSGAGQPFSEIRNITCRVASFPEDTDILRYRIDPSDKLKTHMIARLSRKEGGWLLHAIGESVVARNANEYRELARRHFA